MKNFCLGTALLCSLVTSLQGQAAVNSDYVPTVTSNMTLTTDYIWRGISRTNNGPAIQGEFDITLPVKIYTGIWASNVDFPDQHGKAATLEMQIFAGYKDTYKEIGYDFGVMRYEYPRAHGVNFYEGYVRLAYSLLTASVNYSNDVFNAGCDGTYFNLGFDWPVPERYAADVPGVHVGANFGRYIFDQNLENDRYNDYRIFLHKTFKVITIGLDYTKTDKGFAAENALDGDRIVFSVSAAFV